MFFVFGGVHEIGIEVETAKKYLFILDELLVSSEVIRFSLFSIGLIHTVLSHLFSVGK